MVATSGYVSGYGGRNVHWKSVQAVIDVERDIAKHGLVFGGSIGDAYHLSLHGDHTPWSSDVIFGRRMVRGWEYAIDIMRSPKFEPIKFLDWLVIQCLAGHYPAAKYLISDYVLKDRRYNWARQNGGDGPDHIHLSFMPGQEYGRFTAVGDYMTGHITPGSKAVPIGPAAPTPAHPTATESRHQMALPAVAIHSGSKHLVAQFHRSEKDGRVYQLNLNAAGSDGKVGIRDPSPLTHVARGGGPVDVWTPNGTTVWMGTVYDHGLYVYRNSNIWTHPPDKANSWPAKNLSGKVTAHFDPNCAPRFTDLGGGRFMVSATLTTGQGGVFVFNGKTWSHFNQTAKDVA